MVVVAGREECSLIAETLLDVETEDVAVEAHGTVEVGDLQMDVTDVRARVKRHAGPIATRLRPVFTTRTRYGKSARRSAGPSRRMDAASGLPSAAKRRSPLGFGSQ